MAVASSGLGQLQLAWRLSGPLAQLPGEMTGWPGSSRDGSPRGKRHSVLRVRKDGAADAFCRPRAGREAFGRGGVGKRRSVTEPWSRGRLSPVTLGWCQPDRSALGSALSSVLAASHPQPELDSAEQGAGEG